MLTVATTVLGIMWCAGIHSAATTVSAWMDMSGQTTEATVKVCDCPPLTFRCINIILSSIIIAGSRFTHDVISHRYR